MAPRGPPRCHDELGGRGTQLLSKALRRLGWREEMLHLPAQSMAPAAVPSKAPHTQIPESSVPCLQWCHFYNVALLQSSVTLIKVPET